MWEAFEHAAHFGLDNLTAIIDVNRLGQRGETMVGWSLDTYVARAEAFGWNALEVDGHDVEAIDAGVLPGGCDDRPTDGGRRANEEGEGRRRSRERERLPRQAARRPGAAAVAELGGLRDVRIEVARPEVDTPPRPTPSALELPRYEVGTEVATRKAYGDALAALGTARPDVVALDGEVSTRRSRRRSPRLTPSATSRCTSPSSRWSPRPSGCRRSAGGRSPRPSRRSSRARTTSSAWPRSSRATLRALRLARRRLDRRGRPVADGARGHRVAPRDPRDRRCSTLRRQPDRPAGRPRWPRPTASRYLRTLRPATPVLYPPDEEFAIGGSRVLR